MTQPSCKLEWQRATVLTAGLLAAVAVVAALYFARDILISVALAVFLTFVLTPVVQRLERVGLGRLPAVLATVGLVAVVSALTGWLVVWQMSNLARDLPAKKDSIRAKLMDARALVVGDGSSELGKMVDELGAVFGPQSAVTPTAAPDQRALDPTAGGDPAAVPVVVKQDTDWLGRAETVLSPAAAVAGQAGFAILLSVFMLLKREDLRNRVIRLVGFSQVTTTTKAVDDASQRISRYLLYQLVLNTGFGLVITAALLVAGVQYAILWGVFATVMRYVPYLGTWIGLIPPVLVSFATSDGWTQPLIVIAVYAGLEVFCNNVLEPWLYGASLGLSEVAQLTAAAFWAFLWGPIGLVLSGPLTVCLLVLGKHVPRFRFLEVLLGDEPALTPEVRFYQRLTAKDQDEATDVIRAELNKRPPEQVADAVVVPALTLSRRDADDGALNPDDEKFLLRAVREIADDLLDTRFLQASGGAAADDEPAAPVRVMAVPARDEEDAVVLEVLRGLLDPTQWEMEVAPAGSLISERIEWAARSDPRLILIGSLPPGGLAHTRFLCKRFRREFPNARIAVGRWGLSAVADPAAPPDPTAVAAADKERADLADAGADAVVASLTDMRQHLLGLRSVLTSAATVAAAEGNGKSAARPRVGTAAAK